jgi:hypothetical protein
MYDIKDSRGVPISGGVPPIVRVAIVIVLVGVVIMLSIVGGASRYGHVWPSTDSQNIKL